jgi:FixJ family two-component response regulator
VQNKPVISVVDDDPSVREGTADLVRSMGFVAEAYSCAEEFLKSNQVHGTSCLITDMRMPGMTGLELHDHLLKAGNVIPTILVAAYPDEGEQARARMAGVICYLAKPFKCKDLLACIRSAVESRGRLGREP